MRYILFACALFSLAFAEEKTPLKRSNIHEMMQTFFGKHLKKKGITDRVIKDSLIRYIDNFDPRRTYLLEEEVLPYRRLTDKQLDLLLMQYNRENFTEYERLNQVIQKSILRARAIRNELKESIGIKIPTAPNENFPSSLNELKDRIHYDFGQYASANRNGKDQKRLFLEYDAFKRGEENSYLFKSGDGTPLSDEEKENLMTLHILKAFAKSLDSHSAFFDPEEAYDLKIKLEKGFQGVGIRVRKEGETFYIADIIPNSPAEKSGKIKPGDQLSAINKKAVGIESLAQVIDYLRADDEDVVTLSLKRGGRTFDVLIKKAFVTIEEGRVKEQAIPWNNGVIGFIKIDSFYRGKNEITTETDLKVAIERLKEKGRLKGLIIDLRDNNGGFLSQAVRVAGVFMKTGIVVISKYENGKSKLYRDLDRFDAFDGPIVLLTSKATASAAEIVAQSLQDYGIALVVGDPQTYGKGTIQSQTATDSNATSFFKVTVGKYYTVSGKTPQKSGVEADIVVPGIYHNELIGEEYLEDPIEGGRIAALWRDPMQDVDSSKRPWYLRYYVPSLQKKSTSWKMMLPNLQKRSEKRLSLKRSYQRLLEKPLLTRREEELLKQLQVEEAIEIIKDMNKYAPDQRDKS